jgi:asparagine synthase (glutamine-hydrolysing)
MHGLFRPGLIADGEATVAARCWEEYRPALESLDDLNAFQLLELRSSLPDELLLYGDKLSMAHALEVRVPYLDREVVEHVQQLSASFKVRHGVRKWLHREVSKRLLSSEIIHRKKRGFAVNVVDGWFRQSLDAGIRQYLADPQSQIYQFLEPAAVQSMLGDHAAGRADHHKILFSIVVLEQWLRIAYLMRRTQGKHPAY